MAAAGVEWGGVGWLRKPLKSIASRYCHRQCHRLPDPVPLTLTFFNYPTLLYLHNPHPTMSHWNHPLSVTHLRSSSPQSSIHLRSLQPLSLLVGAPPGPVGAQTLKIHISGGILGQRGTTGRLSRWLDVVNIMIMRQSSSVISAVTRRGNGKLPLSLHFISNPPSHELRSRARQRLLFPALLHDCQRGCATLKSGRWKDENGGEFFFLRIMKELREK